MELPGWVLVGSLVRPVELDKVFDEVDSLYVLTIFWISATIDWAVVT